MIKGPWPTTPDGTRHVIPLEGPVLTPMFNGEQVAIRVTHEDHDKAIRGLGVHGIITDLDTGKQYLLEGAPCSLPTCYCAAKITEIEF